MKKKKEILWLRNIKAFDDSGESIEHYNLSVFEGEVICIMSSRYIYKRIVSNLILGHLQPETGSIFLNEAECADYSPRFAYTHGVSTSDSSNRLIPTMSIEDNLFALKEIINPFSLYKKKAAKIQTAKILERIGLPDLKYKNVIDLLPYQKQVISFEKAIINHSRLIVINNTNLNYTQNELNRLLDSIRMFADQGIGFVIFCDGINDFLTIADRIQYISDKDDYYEFYSVDDLNSFLKDNSNEETFNNYQDKNRVNFRERGFDKANESEAILKAIRSNKFILDEWIRHGTARVVQGRIDKYLIDSASILNNVCLGVYPRISTIGIINKKALYFTLREACEFAGIDDPECKIGELSRLQKLLLVIFREFLIKPQVLAVENPFREMDEQECLILLNAFKRLADKGIILYFYNCRNGQVHTNDDQIIVIDEKCGIMIKKDTF